MRGGRERESGRKHRIPWSHGCDLRRRALCEYSWVRALATRRLLGELIRSSEARLRVEEAEGKNRRQPSGGIATAGQSYETGRGKQGTPAERQARRQDLHLKLLHPYFPLALVRKSASQTEEQRRKQTSREHLPSGQSCTGRSGHARRAPPTRVSAASSRLCAATS